VLLGNQLINRCLGEFICNQYIHRMKMLGVRNKPPVFSTQAMAANSGPH
jgi:hypothetical protein